MITKTAALYIAHYIENVKVSATKIYYAYPDAASGADADFSEVYGSISADNSSLNAQRYPVNIVFEGGDIPENVRYGSKATVAFLTEQSTFGEWLASFWMRVLSIWTYVS